MPTILKFNTKAFTPSKRVNHRNGVNSLSYSERDNNMSQDVNVNEANRITVSKLVDQRRDSNHLVVHPKVDIFQISSAEGTPSRRGRSLNSSRDSRIKRHLEKKKQSDFYKMKDGDES